MPETHDAENVKSELDLAHLVARIGATYTKNGLSPPFAWRNASWGGLSEDEIVAVIEMHFQDCRHFYTTGAGEQHFGMVHQAIRKAIEAKYPRAYVDDEPVRPPRRRSGRVRQIHNAAGVRPDVMIDGGRAASLLGDPVSNIRPPSGLVGYERSSNPMGDDDDPGEAV